MLTDLKSFCLCFIQILAMLNSNASHLSVRCTLLDLLVQIRDQIYGGCIILCENYSDKRSSILKFLLRDIYLVTYLNVHPDKNSHRQYENLQRLGRSIHSWSQTSRPLQLKGSILKVVAEIAQLGEGQTEYLKVPGSNPESSLA